MISQGRNPTVFFCKVCLVPGFSSSCLSREALLLMRNENETRSHSWLQTEIQTELVNSLFALGCLTQVISTIHFPWSTARRALFGEIKCSIRDRYLLNFYRPFFFLFFFVVVGPCCCCCCCCCWTLPT